MNGPPERRLPRIELIVAITVVGIGALALSVRFPQALQRVDAGDLESRATLHVQAKLEELESLPWDQLLATVGADSLEDAFERRWQVREDEPVLGMKLVEVSIRWRDSRGPRSVSLSSFLSDAGAP